jgi:hypothetical protein
MKYYSSIAELPLRNFINVLVDDNIYALLIDGEADLITLQEAWSEILQEYQQSIGDSEHQMYTLLYKELKLLEIDYTIVTELVPVLQLVYRQKFADELNKILETSFEFDWDNQEKYQQELQRCLNRNKAIKIQLELKRKEFEEIEKKNKYEHKKPSREYFLSVLINLSNYAKYQITDQITTFEFCQRVKQLNQYLTSLEKLTPK